MTTEKVGAEILSDHNTLRALIGALEKHFQQRADAELWYETLREKVSALVDLCCEHFRLEEQSGLHVQLRQQSPRHAFRLEKLLGEHASILAGLQNLATDLATDSITAIETDSLKERVLLALESVRQHESAENEVMTDVYWDDLGGEAG